MNRGMNGAAALSGVFADWYWETDAELRLTYTSPQFAQTTGLEPADDYFEHNRRTLERHEAFRDFEIQRRTRDGDLVWLAVSGEPIVDGAGQFKGYHGVGRNVTKKKRAEQLLRLEHAVARALSEATSV